MGGDGFSYSSSASASSSASSSSSGGSFADAFSSAFGGGSASASSYASGNPPASAYSYSPAYGSHPAAEAYQPAPYQPPVAAYQPPVAAYQPAPSWGAGDGSSWATPAAPSYAPVAPAAPVARQWEHQGPSTGFSFGNLDNKQDIVYNTPSNYGMGYQKFSDWANPNNSGGSYGSWLNSQMGETVNRYNVAMTDEGSGNMKWVDYLEKMAPGFRGQFNSLSAKQRGENPGLYESGVYLG